MKKIIIGILILTGMIVLTFLLLERIKQRPKPTLEFIANPIQGTTPLAVQFQVRIHANRWWSLKLHCLSSSFAPGDGTFILSNPLCVSYNPFTDFVPIQRDFSFTHTYKQPGEYQAAYSTDGLQQSIIIRVR